VPSSPALPPPSPPSFFSPSLDRPPRPSRGGKPKLLRPAPGPGVVLLSPIAALFNVVHPLSVGQHVRRGGLHVKLKTVRVCCFTQSFRIGSRSSKGYPPSSCLGPAGAASPGCGFPSVRPLRAWATSFPQFPPFLFKTGLEG